MAHRTSRYGLTTFDSASDTLDAHNWKFTDADRILLDKLLTYAAERHVHTGVTTGGSDARPGTAPVATLARTGGILPAGTAVRYRCALVDPRGQEQVASKETVVYTPPKLFNPDPPTAAAVPTGTLMAGAYTYGISAYTNESSRETPLSRLVTILLPSTGGVTLGLPTPPSGATGFNIYRRSPAETALVFLKTVSATLTTWSDTGATTANPLRGIPAGNTTSTTSSVSVAPAAALPAGSTWKLYRTTTVGSWDDSLVAWSSTSPIVDTGHATSVGSPAAMSAAVATAPKVDLTDCAETTGVPPPGMLATIHVVSFCTGDIVAGVVSWHWLNEYEHAALLSMRATVGRDRPPSANAVQVGLDVYRQGSATPGWESVTQPPSTAPLCSVIPVGETIGSLVSLTTATPTTALEPGDRLRVQVYDSGGGATPTDRDLAFTVLLAVGQGSTSASYVWETV